MMAAALGFPSVSPLSSSNGLVLGQGIVCEKQSANTTRMRSQNIVIRCSKAEGPLRRPSAPVAAPFMTTSAPPPATPPPPPPPPAAPQSPASSASAPSAAAALVSSSKSSSLSIEYQRQRAKEMQDYFLDKKFEDQIRAGRLFGWTQKNEIGNGRWAMFGIAVGLLTEYATGSSFVEQLKIIISNLGIADLD
ncbi:unnamed protein product [Sphagnum troendelagicum]|uniref:Uncharacterized protein n=1 Tax=Sphagnum troendelagicum TaxID=128251 RepID=A0ABP0TKM6_9BRYO